MSASEKRTRSDSNSSVETSPWEAKRMKIDLIAAKAKIIELEARVNHQHRIRKQVEILHEGEKEYLLEQHKRDERALSDMEGRLQTIRRREQDLKKEYNEEVATLKFERDKATTQLNDTLVVRQNQQSLIHSLQKLLLLVMTERDSYRQQLDSYEKELTVTLSGAPGAGSTALLSARVEHLEKALQDYRDLLATQDQEAQAKAIESARADASKFREEAEAAKREASKLRVQRDQLQLHLEKLAAPTKVGEIPAAAAHKQMQVDLKSVQEEIKKLKAALRDGGNRTCPEEVNQLRTQLENSRIELQRMKEEFTSSAQEYRD